MSYVYSSEWEMNLKSDAFNSMKDDFNKVIKRTLLNMENKDSEDAEITVKLKINLTKNEAGIENGEKKYTTIPRFSHKVSSVMQIKDELSGSLGGNYELVWCEERQEWIMKEIRDGQSSFFDADYEYDIVDIEPEECDVKMLADPNGDTDIIDVEQASEFTPLPGCLTDYPECHCLKCQNYTDVCCLENNMVCDQGMECKDYEPKEESAE